uniref:MULE transposase domain-containing protein n=1 Tax=Ditylenchus dipsaci TaxID=166011 RepID=A0A915DIA5_9BILA
MPSKIEQCRAVYREKKRILHLPANPTGLVFNIPRNLIYFNGPEEQELFVLGDTRDNERVILLGRQSTRNWISTVTHISGDGTFAASPSIFVQVYVILAEREDGFMFPIAHVLLPRKSQEIYIKMFSLLRDAFPQLLPESFSCDFEKGIPEDRARNVRERRARYPPVEWKLFQRTLDQHSRSNNFNESNNKKLMKIVGTPHPHLWDFMLRVKTAYLSDYDNDFNDWVHGRGHRHRKRQAINRDTRIRNQVHRYQQFLAGRLTAEEYLNGMVVALRG